MARLEDLAFPEEGAPGSAPESRPGGSDSRRSLGPSAPGRPVLTGPIRWEGGRLLQEGEPCTAGSASAATAGGAASAASSTPAGATGSPSAGGTSGGSTASGAAPTVPTPSAPSASAAGELTVDQILAALHPVGYLSGPAGTGKTWLARQIIAERDDAVLAATTGIAAVNLGEATTINALLQYFDTQSLMESYASGWLQTRLRQLRRSGIRLIVLDEVSMLDADQLTVLVAALDDVNLKKAYDASLETVTLEEDDRGLMKLLLVGDFAQLPPVEAPFAFESPTWSRFAESTFKLETIRRQGDQQFVQALQAVRKGRAREALAVLEPRMVPSLDFNFAGTTIVAKNDEVDRINTLRHQKLPGPAYTWTTIRSGDQEKDWLRLIPEALTVKKGATVMILANRPYPKLDEDDASPPGYYYVNGDLATVVGEEKIGIRVMLHRTFEEVTVVPAVREKKVATGKKKPRWEIKGTCSYMPLRLAYATTVHKSQGLSLDQVQIAIHSWMFGKPGMLYVALSRCRSLEGLRIVGNAKQFLGKVTVDKKVEAFL